MSKKLFISLPMRGHSDEEISLRMHSIYELAIIALGENYELINTMWEDPLPNPNNQIWYLGKSIQALGEADLVIFAFGWAQAKGCITERVICDLYKIPKMDEDELVSLREVRDLTNVFRTAK